ncbi:MAG: YceI family protein [Bdellovibrionota bacterium]|nr:YceI family protein [Bdellovibrionota bacterium]
MLKLISLSLLVLSLSVFAEGKKALDVTVNLTPAGSFQIQADKVKGKVEKKGDVYMAKKLWVKAKDLKTGIELRDDHMLKRIEADKHKNIIVSDVKAKGGKGIGKITIKGITKKIQFAYKVSGSKMLAKFSVSLADFQVKDLKYLGVGAKDKVEIAAIVPVK